MTRSPFEPSPDVVARNDLMAALKRLPFAHHVRRELPTSSLTLTVDWMLAVTAWVDELDGVLNTVSRAHSDVATELDKLRAEREAVRSFLGTTGRTQ